MKIHYALACAAGLGIPAGLYSQENAVPKVPMGIAAVPRPDSKSRWTLSEAISAARTHNPEMLALEAAAPTAKGAVITAKTWANPELTIEPGVRRSLEDTTFVTAFNGLVSLSQPFKFPGKRALDIAIAQADVTSRELAIDAFRFQLAAKVRRAFFGLLVAQKIVGARSEQVASAKVFVESAKRRAESGYAGEFESLKSQADLITAQSALREAEGKAATARIVLNTLMARPPSSPLVLAGSLDQVDPKGAAGDFIALALARNPALMAMELEAKKSGLQVKRSRMDHLPDFSVGPSFEYYKDEQVAAISAKAELPVWNQNKGGIQTATAQQRQNLAEIRRLRLEIGGAVTTAVSTLSVARDQLALYSPAFLTKMQNYIRQAEQSYAQSATTLIIFLDAKRTYFDTLTSYYEALGKVAESRSELESAVGVPLELKD